MKMKVNPGALIVLGCTILIGSPAEAKPKAQKILNVPAAAFVMESNAVSFYNSGGNLFVTGGGPQYIRAPISLPGGVTIKKIVMVCKDNDAVWDIRCWLHRISNDFTTNSAIAEVASTGASPSWQSFTATMSAALDNANYVYILNVRMNEAADGSTAISHVKIYYTEK